MTTQSHVILNMALLSKRGKPFLHSYAFLGAVIPDLPIFIFFGVETFILQTPQRELWGSRYFMEAWQHFFDLFNAVPLILILLGMGSYLMRSERVTVVAWSMLIHCAFDFLTHHDDGHRHLFPLSDFVFESPVSYWDGDYHAGPFQSVECLVILAASLYLFPRLRTRLGRAALGVINVVFLAFFVGRVVRG